MNCLKIIVPIFIGTFLYSLLSITLGPRGIIPMKHLNTEYTKITQNLTELTVIQEDLESTIKNLTANTDTISVYAHAIGYVADGERLISLQGLSRGIRTNHYAGSIVSYTKPEYLPEWLSKIFSIFIATVVFFILNFFVKDTKIKNKQRISRIY